MNQQDTGHQMASAESRENSATNSTPLLRVADLVVDLDRRSVMRGNERLELTDRTFRLLEVLIRHAPDEVSKDDLAAQVWDNSVVSDETIAQRVRLLRQSLGDDSKDPRYIASVRGRGYRLVAELGDAGSTSARRRWSIWPIAIAVLLAGAFLFWQLPSSPVRENRMGTLAVLPFTDMSANNTHQYFADGMHEELLSRLAMIDGLAVISRTSVERFRGSMASLPDIAEELGVDAIIEGSVRVDNNNLRVTVQLIDAVSDEHTWAETFDRQLSMQDVFQLQADVSNQIAEALRLEYADADATRSPLPTDSIEAYNYYLLGRYHTFELTQVGLETAVPYLEQAIAIDPEFAGAYATLGWAYSFLGAEYGTHAPREMYPKAKEAALRALALDANFSDARTLYADILTWYDWDFVTAEREYQKTVELDPLNVLGYALFLSTQERHEEAVAMVERRLAADPNDPFVIINAGWRYYNAGMTQKAIEAAIAAESHFDSASLLGLSRLAEGNAVAATAVFEEALETQGRTALNLAHLAVSYFKQGRTVDAERLTAELNSMDKDDYVSPALLASVYFAAGDADRAFALMEEALDERSRDMIFLKVNGTLDGYRDDPRYTSLVERVGL